MAEQNFVDYVKIHFRSGHGGAGSVHFFRDNKNPKGGPDGGDGGRGGNIILKGNAHMWTLLPLRYRKHIIAGDGEPGRGSHSSGASGKDIIIEVPVGTVLKDGDSGAFELEITSHGESKIAMLGGRGGLGNSHFKSPTRQAPKFAQPGEPGQEGWKILELKILADVGLVGFPNAGKSTLLAALSAAKPKIADYPFTTLTPNLGIVNYHDNKSFIMADIPGIIEKASEGKGLGLRFLRHIERNAVLLFLIPSDTDEIIKQYSILLNELESYNPELIHKPRMLAISKSDILDDEMKALISKEMKLNIPWLFISAVSGFGLSELKDQLWNMLNQGDFKNQSI
ncbi:MAG TPA: GTPase ObgE [Saprospiraceae bacterium]|nr:GTPase ObgE [Saprospiraceae bacterium]